MENTLKKNKIKRIISLILLVVTVGLLIGILFLSKDDGMVQTKGISIYYRTYTKENGWSKWSKNGITSGDLKNDIQNIQVKVIKKEYSQVTYKIYTEDWSESYTKDSKIKNSKMYGLQLSLSDAAYKDYNIYYRTYNSKDKWLDWTFAGYTSGNKDESIKAVEIKAVPRGVVLRDYLKDYNNTNNNSSVGF